MQTRELNPGALEPVTLEEAKQYARVASQNLEDGLIRGLISAARRHCEEYARISISPRQWVTSYRAPTYRSLGMGLGGSWQDPEGVVRGMTIPRPPLVSLDALEWVTPTGKVAATDYVLDADARRVRWTKPFDQVMIPDNALSLTATYTAGYPAEDGETPQVCIAPPEIHTAMLVMTAHLYENRASEKKIMMPYQVMELLRGHWQSASVA